VDAEGRVIEGIRQNARPSQVDKTRSSRNSGLDSNCCTHAQLTPSKNIKMISIISSNTPNVKRLRENHLPPCIHRHRADGGRLCMALLRELRPMGTDGASSRCPSTAIAYQTPEPAPL